jgi:hypothetical protein
MKRIVITLALLHSFLFVFAQRTISTDKVNVNKEIKLAGYQITGFSNDGIFTQHRTDILPTEHAVKNYVDTRFANFTAPTGSTLYTADGTLTANRTINANAKSLLFSNVASFQVGFSASSYFKIIDGTPLTRGIFCTLYDSTYSLVSPIKSITTFDNFGRMERHTVAELAQVIGNATVSGAGVLIRNGSANLGGTLQNPAPYISNKRILRYFADTCSLELNRVQGATLYVPLRFKSQDALDPSLGIPVNSKIEFEHRDNDNMHTNTHSIVTRHDDFVVKSQGNLLLYDKYNSISLNSITGFAGQSTFTIQNSNGTYYNNINLQTTSTGSTFVKFGAFTQTRNDTGNPLCVASFDNSGNLNRHPLTEMKTALAYKASEVSFTPIAATTVNISIDSNNVQGAIFQIAKILKVPVTNYNITTVEAGTNINYKGKLVYTKILNNTNCSSVTYDANLKRLYIVYQEPATTPISLLWDFKTLGSRAIAFRQTGSSIGGGSAVYNFEIDWAAPIVVNQTGYEFQMEYIR